MQIRDYIKQASSMMDNLKKSADPVSNQLRKNIGYYFDLKIPAKVQSWVELWLVIVHYLSAVPLFQNQCVQNADLFFFLLKWMKNINSIVVITFTALVWNTCGI